MKLKMICVQAVVILVCGFAFSYNPPVAGEDMYSLTSPAMLGNEMSVAGGSMFRVYPEYVTINPAIPAGEQRVVVDFSYTALVSSQQEKTYGQAFNIGTLIPSRYGVFAAVVQGVFIPFESMDLGSGVTLRGAFSKDVSDSLYVGMGVSVAFGSDWALNADLGMLYVIDRLRWLPFMSDIRVGVSMTGMGKAFESSGYGIDGVDSVSSGFPGMFTPHAGFAGTFLDTKYVQGGLSLDLSFPTFQNMIFDANLQFLFANIISLSTGWEYNLREALQNKASLYPTVSLAVQFGFETDAESILAQRGLRENEMVVSGAYRNLYNNVHVASGGTAIYFGLEDVDAPEIILWGNNE